MRYLPSGRLLPKRAESSPLGSRRHWTLTSSGVPEFRSSEGVSKSKTVAVASFREIFFILVESQRKSESKKRAKERKSRAKRRSVPSACLLRREAEPPHHIFVTQLPSHLTFEAILC